MCTNTKVESHLRVKSSIFSGALMHSIALFIDFLMNRTNSWCVAPGSSISTTLNQHNNLRAQYTKMAAHPRYTNVSQPEWFSKCSLAQSASAAAAGDGSDERLLQRAVLCSKINGLVRVIETRSSCYQR